VRQRRLPVQGHPVPCQNGTTGGFASARELWARGSIRSEPALVTRSALSGSRALPWALQPLWRLDCKVVPNVPCVERCGRFEE
jgi:hypothetical protein